MGWKKNQWHRSPAAANLHESHDLFTQTREAWNCWVPPSWHVWHSILLKRNGIYTHIKWCGLTQYFSYLSSRWCIWQHLLSLFSSLADSIYRWEKRTLARKTTTKVSELNLLHSCKSLSRTFSKLEDADRAWGQINIFLNQSTFILYFWCMLYQ